MRESSREISIEACLRKLMAPKIDVLGHFRIYICFFAQLNTHWFMPSAQKNNIYRHVYMLVMEIPRSLYATQPTQLRTAIFSQ